MSSWVSCCCTDIGLSSGAHWVGVDWSNSRRGGGLLLYTLMCFRTAMQFVYAVCLQAMTHSVDNDPTQQAVKLVVVGIGFVEQSWLRLFLGDQFQR